MKILPKKIAYVYLLSQGEKQMQASGKHLTSVTIWVYQGKREMFYVSFILRIFDFLKKKSRKEEEIRASLT